MTTEADLNWIIDTLDEHRVGQLDVAKPLYWKFAVNGECHANVRSFCQKNPEWQPVFGYAVDTLGGGKYVMHNHSVVRETESGPLRHLTSDKKDAKIGLFVADSVISGGMHKRVQCADDRLHELLFKPFSEPDRIRDIAVMPFGRDKDAEMDTARIHRKASIPRDNTRRSWVIASGMTDNGTPITISFGLFYDDALRGLIVGVPRLYVAAALAKREREVGVADHSGNKETDLAC